MGLLKHVYLIINKYNKQICAMLWPEQSSQAISKIITGIVEILILMKKHIPSRDVRKATFKQDNC